MKFEDVELKSEEEIGEVARLMVGGHYFDWVMCPESLVSIVFVPIAFGILKDLSEEELNKIWVWEDIGKAGPRSINGFPMFFSCKVWLKSDILSAYNKYKQAMELIGVKGVPEDGKGNEESGGRSG